MQATHFILVYAFVSTNLGTGIRRKDYYSTGVREIKYLHKVAACNPQENVAVFKIKLKHDL